MKYLFQLKRLLGDFYRLIFKKALVKFYGTRQISFKRYNNLKLDIDFNKDVDFRIFIRKFEDQILYVFQKLLNPDSIVLDIGANIGLYSLIAAQKVKGENHIYAFEPAPKAYQNLLKNISLNKAFHITAHNCCIADFEGEITLNICVDDAYNSIGTSPILQIQEQVNTPVITIDAFVEKYSLPKVDIIKIDTEGAEMLVFEGARKTLENFSPIIFFEINQKVLQGFDYSSKDLLIFLETYGYQIFDINKNNQLKKFDVKNFTSDSDGLVAFPSDFDVNLLRKVL